MKKTANVVRRIRVLVSISGSRRFYAKARLEPRIMGSDIRNASVCPIGEEIVRLFICALCHDDIMDRGARYLAASLREKAKFFKIVLLTGGHRTGTLENLTNKNHRILCVRLQ